MNPAYNSNSSATSFRFLDLNDDPIPESEQYDSISTYSVPTQQTPASSSTCPDFFNLSQDYETRSHLGDCPQTSQKVDKKVVLDEDCIKDHVKMVDHKNRSTGTTEDGSMKWMSPKMRVTKIMLHSNKSSGTDLYMPAKSNDANQSNQINTAADIIRVCSDCNTTETPLWRGGPQGPKSLCNACGIRRRKARKAMTLAAEAAENHTNIVNKMEYYSSTGPSKNHKEKKSRTRYHNVTESHQTTAKSKLSFEDFSMSLMKRKSTEMFPRDEEEAAILLMALSCGLVHS